MAGSGATLAKANAAMALALNAMSQASASQASANQPKATVIYAAAYGVVADGITDNSVALYSAINAAQTAASTSSNAQFCEVVLPAGKIRITSPLVVMNNLTSIGMRLRGAGRSGTIILADFFTSAAAPRFTMGGGGSPAAAAVLYPIIDYGVLTGVRILSGGAGYTSAPTATLTAAAGSGATVTCTVSGGAVTGVTITAGGTGYSSPYAGDALVVRGINVEIVDLSVQASAARTAATNGGNSAYPYFTINNGIRYEPFGNGGPTQTLNLLARISVNGQPGHGIMAARQENWTVEQVQSTSNGADGLFLHSQGFPVLGISNTIKQYRCTKNATRGLQIIGMTQCTVVDSSIYNNIAGASLPPGVNEEVYLSYCYAFDFRSDVEVNGGITAGKDVLVLEASFGVTVAGYFRGGRFGISCKTVRAAQFGPIHHFGNPTDPSNSTLLLDNGTGGPSDAQWAPIIGPIFNGGNVNLTVNRAPLSIFTNGPERGVMRFIGLQGSQFAASVSGSVTPDPLTNGCDQYFTLTGATTFIEPTPSGNGTRMVLTFIQDATGGRVVTMGGTKYIGPNIASIGSGTANQIGTLELMCKITGSRTVWQQQSWSGWA